MRSRNLAPIRLSRDHGIRMYPPVWDVGQKVYVESSERSTTMGQTGIQERGKARFRLNVIHTPTWKPAIVNPGTD